MKQWKKTSAQGATNRWIKIGGGLLVFVAMWGGATGFADLYVSDTGDSRVVRFDSSGDEIVFASTGLSSPTGLAFDSAGNLFVADSGANSIFKITPLGVMTTFDTATLNHPDGLAFDSHGNLFVANGYGNTISEITPGGAASIFGTADYTGPETGPFGLAIDSSDDVYVAGFNEIDKFTSSGVKSIFTSGYANVNNPTGLALDSSNNLYVVNYGAANIVKFTPSGTRSVFASDNYPYYDVVDSAGDVYVSNPTTVDGPSAIKIFTPSGTSSTYTATGLTSPTFMVFGPSPVPEPAAASLLSLAVGMLCTRRKRRGPSGD